MEWNFDNVKYNGKDLDRVQVDGVTVWEKKKVVFYDYLENDGKAYINTNYYPNQSTKLITKKRYSLNSTSILFGEMDQGLSAGRDAFFISKTQFGFDKLVFSVSVAPEGTEPYLLELSVDGLYRDGVLISKPKSDIATTWTSPREMYLFGVNRGNAVTVNKTALYYCRIYDNGVLVRDYKPCLYNGEAGLWDSVEGKFYGNANNTGTLTVGNDE